METSFGVIWRLLVSTSAQLGSFWGLLVMGAVWFELSGGNVHVTSPLTFSAEAEAAPGPSSCSYKIPFSAAGSRRVGSSKKLPWLVIRKTIGRQLHWYTINGHFSHFLSRYVKHFLHFFVISDSELKVFGFFGLLLDDNVTDYLNLARSSWCCNILQPEIWTWLGLGSWRLRTWLTEWFDILSRVAVLFSHWAFDQNRLSTSCCCNFTLKAFNW